MWSVDVRERAVARDSREAAIREDELPLQPLPGAVRAGCGVKGRYVMVRYTESTVLFDERFVDYGCNKVQYIDHLRNIGYQFYLLTQAFAMDVIHHE